MSIRPVAVVTGAVAAAVVAALVLSAVGEGAPQGARNALPAEARSMTAAIKSSPLGGLRRTRAQYDVKDARVSLVSPYWATAKEVPKPAFRDRLDGGYSVLVRLADPLLRVGPWVVVDTGTDGVGCRIAPIRVLRSLGIAAGCGRGERL
jgi:hypothetical protein